MKDQVIHARISESTKRESEQILSRIGMTISQAVDLYLRQIVLKKAIPFELTAIEKEDEVEELAYLINSVDGGEVPPKAKTIIHLFASGVIDLETAKFAWGRMFGQ